MKKVVYTWYLFSWLSTTKMTKCKQWKWHQTRFCPCAPDLPKHWAEHMILMSDHNSVWWSLVGQGSTKVEVEHQVLQILSNPSKANFVKGQHSPLATYEKVVYTWYMFSWLSTTKMAKCKQWKWHQTRFCPSAPDLKNIGQSIWSWCLTTTQFDGP